MQTPHKHAKGFLVIDLVTGLLVLAVLATAVAALAGQHRVMMQKLVQRRAAVDAAEFAITALAQHKPIPNQDGVTISVTPLAINAGISGEHWVEIKAAIGISNARLVGLVPDENGGTK